MLSSCPRCLAFRQPRGSEITMHPALRKPVTGGAALALAVATVQSANAGHIKLDFASGGGANCLDDGRVQRRNRFPPFDVGSHADRWREACPSPPTRATA